MLYKKMSDAPSSIIGEGASSLPPTQSPVTPPPQIVPPTISPTAERLPSSFPTVSTIPSYTPSFHPSAAPSVTNVEEISKGFATQLYVNEARIMGDIEQTFFVGIMESHTKEIGAEVGVPFIKTECTIVDQELGETPVTMKFDEDSRALRGNIISRRRYMQQNNITTSTDTTNNVNYTTSNTDTNTDTPIDKIYLLQVTYIMNWYTRYGYDISTYPDDFRVWMNGDNGSTLEAMKQKLEIELNWDYVVKVGITAEANNVTAFPTVSPTVTPEVVPKVANTPTPTVMLVTTMSPSEIPSSMPSEIPTTHKKDCTNEKCEIVGTVVKPYEPDNNPASGALIGVLVAFLIVGVGTIIVIAIRLYRKRKYGNAEDASTTDIAGKEQYDNGPSSDRREDTARSQAAVQAAKVQFSSGLSPSILEQFDSKGESSHSASRSAISISQHDNVEAGIVRLTQGEGSGTISIGQTDMAQKGLIYPDRQTDMAQKGLTYPSSTGDEIGIETSTSPSSVASPNKDSPFNGANLIANRSNSFSSEESLSETISSFVSKSDADGDEFDKYRNQLLETFRSEVEVSVDDVDTMLSLAITRILMEDNTPLDISWIGGEDLGSIEASCLCETFEHERKRDPYARSTVMGNEFFEDMMNRIVFIVHHGLIRPHDGARILHSCASIMGLSLLKDLPNTTVVIQGLIKSNELSKAHDLLVKAFEEFGDIVDAAIAPNNRGFGFVRFVESESVDAVMLKHRTSTEIEIEDVAVSIKTLGPATANGSEHD